MSNKEKMGVSDSEVVETSNNKTNATELDSEVVETSDNKTNATELKKELMRLATAICQDDDADEEGKSESTANGAILDKIDKAIQALSALKVLELRRQMKSPLSSQLDSLDIPDEFQCPISREIMKDPVVLATGQTYDRPYIQKWLAEGRRTCPQTQQVLSHIFLTPNQLVRDLISRWCKDRGIELPPPVVDPAEIITDADRDRLNLLLNKTSSSSVSDQKEAAKEIRLLTKRMSSFLSLFCESPDSIPLLLKPLTVQERIDDHPDLQEDLITAVLNLSIHDSNKKILAEDPLVIPVLVESLRQGEIQTKANAAAALFTLSALNSNKILIMESGALKPLIELLDEGHPLAVKDAAAAVYTLCEIVENRGKAVADGVVRVILDKISNGVLVSELLSLLALLTHHEAANEELAKLGGVRCLLTIIRESTSEKIKENCIAIVEMTCLYKRAQLKEVREEERLNGTISKLAENGNSRAQRKANSVLARMRKSSNLTHTA